VKKSRRKRWMTNAEHMGELRSTYKMLVGKSDGKRLRHVWEDNINMDCKELGCENVDLIHLS
jgi:hypothetical protein